MRLANKTAIVTGGGSGIGEAICVAFAREGAAVAVADRNLKGAENVVSMIKAAGGRAIAVEVDITDLPAIKRMEDSVQKSLGQVDILVNNAGARVIRGFMQHSLDDWNTMIDINLSGPFHCAQAVVPAMAANGGGVIINLCSIASYMGRPNRCAYVAAKTGLLGLTRAMAMDLSPKKIRVNAIAPGMVASPFNMSFAEAEETGDAWAGENLSGRWGQPEDIAGAAVFLASDESSFVNGSEIKVEGGWLAARARAGEVPE
ncbi:MAG: glucose 1-dehydrogenase [Candidatus Binatia bacterium]